MNENPQPLAKRGEFSVKFSTGETIPLKFSYQSMMRMEQRIGYSLTTVAKDVASLNIKIKPTIDILYEACLEAKHKTTYNDLADLVIDAGFVSITKEVITYVLAMMTSGSEEIPAGKEEPEKA